VVDSLLAIHQQGEDTARIAECLAGLLCRKVQDMNQYRVDLFWLNDVESLESTAEALEAVDVSWG
jgi:hypothetical protein